MKILQINTISFRSRFGGAEVSGAIMQLDMERQGWEVAELYLRPREKICQNGIREEGEGRWSIAVPNVRWPLTTSYRRRQAVLYHLIDLFNPITLLKVYILLGRLMPDVVVCHNLKGWSPSLWLAVRLRRIRTVQILHDFGTICSRAQQFRPKGDCSRRCIECAPRRLMSKALWAGGNSIVGVSSDTLQRHVKSGVYGSSRGYVVYPSLSSTHSAESGVDSARKYDFGYIGRIEAVKGVEEFVRSAHRVGAVAAVAGSGDEALEASLRVAYPDIAWLGWTAPDQFFSEIRCLVVPSLWPEPFGRIIAEAAAFRVPVLAFNLGGIREAAAVSGARIMLVEPNEEALISAMKAPKFKILPPVAEDSHTGIVDVLRLVTPT